MKKSVFSTFISTKILICRAKLFYKVFLAFIIFKKQIFAFSVMLWSGLNSSQDSIKLCFIQNRTIFESGLYLSQASISEFTVSVNVDTSYFFQEMVITQGVIHKGHQNIWAKIFENIMDSSYFLIFFKYGCILYLRK